MRYNNWLMGTRKIEKAELIIVGRRSAGRLYTSFDHTGSRPQSRSAGQGLLFLPSCELAGDCRHVNWVAAVGWVLLEVLADRTFDSRVFQRPSAGLESRAESRSVARRRYHPAGAGLTRPSSAGRAIRFSLKSSRDERCVNDIARRVAQGLQMLPHSALHRGIAQSVETEMDQPLQGFWHFLHAAARASGDRNA